MEDRRASSSALASPIRRDDFRHSTSLKISSRCRDADAPVPETFDTSLLSDTCATQSADYRPANLVEAGKVRRREPLVKIIDFKLDFVGHRSSRRPSFVAAQCRLPLWNRQLLASVVFHHRPQSGAYRPFIGPALKVGLGSTHEVAALQPLRGGVSREAGNRWRGQR